MMDDSVGVRACVCVCVSYLSLVVSMRQKRQHTRQRCCALLCTWHSAERMQPVRQVLDLQWPRQIHTTSDKQPNRHSHACLSHSTGLAKVMH